MHSVGKIFDVFLGRGISDYEKTNNNADGMAKTLETMAAVDAGLIFVNLVDFDQQYGHRNDPAGFARALEEFDSRLDEMLARLRSDDLCMITADHGNDPTTPSTDHSREYTPLLCAGPRVRAGRDLGTRATFVDVGATLAELFGVDALAFGKSFLRELRA